MKKKVSDFIKREKLILEGFKRVSKQLGILNEEEAVASDGGYYNKNTDVVVSQEEAELIKKQASELFNQMFSNEGVGYATHKENIKLEIINQLRKDGISIEADDEDNVYFWFWFPEGTDLNLAKNEFKFVVDNLYDRVDKSNISEDIGETHQARFNRAIYLTYVEQNKKTKRVSKEEFYSQLSDIVADKKEVNYDMTYRHRLADKKEVWFDKRKRVIGEIFKETDEWDDYVESYWINLDEY